MISFRPATMADARQIFDWRNDPLVRQNSFNQNELKWEEHLKWFEQKVNNSRCQMFIICNENTIPIGQVRFDLDEKKTAVVSISLEEKFRSKGNGEESLRQTCGHLTKEHKAERIIAYIKKENKASYRSFLKAGFKVAAEAKIHSIDSYVLEWQKGA